MRTRGERSPERPRFQSRHPSRRASGPAPSEKAEPGAGSAAAEAARARFREVDDYRADREWNRYEGTPQRELFRQLRERFLERHRAAGSWTLEIGPGPGRFTGFIGSRKGRRVLLDLSNVMLERARSSSAGSNAERFSPDPIRGDGFRPPLHDGLFAEVVALGNVLGFAREPFAESLGGLAKLAASGGRLVFEIMPGAGERSRYLARLPPRAVGRLLRSPVRAVRPRIEREGFAPRSGKPAKEHGFQRRTTAEIVGALAPSGWALEEGMAVAPALGFDPDRIAEARADPAAWTHLLQVEEEIGRLPERWERSAAMMLSLRRAGGGAR